MSHGKLKPAVAMNFKVGIIGGSDLKDLQILENPVVVTMRTPFGIPSDSYTTGTINGVQCILLSRPGKKHDIMPGNVNYRANLWGFMKLGASVIIASTACASLQEHIEPGHMVFPNSVLDRTIGRKSTFFDNSYSECPGVCHIQPDPIYHPLLREILIDGAKELGYEHHVGGFGVCIEGPRFATQAESQIFRSYGASFVDMTMMPECVLAKELGMLYVSVAFVTGYSCWKEGEHVSMEQVMTPFEKNSEKTKQLIMLSVQKAAKHEWRKQYKPLRKSTRSSVMLPENIIIPHLDNYGGKLNVKVENDKSMKEALKRERNLPSNGLDISFSEVEEQSNGKSHSFNEPDRKKMGFSRRAENPWKPDILKNEDEKDDQLMQLLRKVRALLNKITPTTKEELIEEFISFKICEVSLDAEHTAEDQLDKVIDIIFDKAVENSKFCPLYTEVYKRLVDEEITENSKLSKLRNGLLNRAQSLFVNRNFQETWASKVKAMEDEADAELKAELKTEIEQLEQKFRERKFGNMIFIGQLYYQKLLSIEVVNCCLYDLIKHTRKPNEQLPKPAYEEESLQCAVKMMESLRKQFETADDFAGKQYLNRTLDHLKEISCFCTNGTKFMILGLDELRCNKWKQLKALDQGPKKITEIHDEFKQEEMELLHLRQCFMRKQKWCTSRKARCRPSSPSIQNSWRIGLSGSVGVNQESSNPVTEASKKKIKKTSKSSRDGSENRKLADRASPLQDNEENQEDEQERERVMERLAKCISSGLEEVESSLMSVEVMSSDLKANVVKNYEKPTTSDVFQRIVKSAVERIPLKSLPTLGHVLFEALQESENKTSAPTDIANYCTYAVKTEAWCDYPKVVWHGIAEVIINSIFCKTALFEGPQSCYNDFAQSFINASEDSRNNRPNELPVTLLRLMAEKLEEISVSRTTHHFP